MTEPPALTDADLLAWAVVLEHRRQQGRAGIQGLLLPFPPCPACGQAVTEATAWWEREPHCDDVTIDMRPCGDAHHASIGDVQRIQPHLTAMLASLEDKPRHTDDIIREATQLVGGAAGRADADPRQLAYDAAVACLAANPDVPRDLVSRNAIAWLAIHAAVDAILGARTTPDNPPTSGDAAGNSDAEAAVERVDRLALTFEVSGNEFIAEQIRAAIKPPTHDGPTVAEAAADDLAHWPQREWEDASHE